MSSTVCPFLNMLSYHQLHRLSNASHTSDAFHEELTDEYALVLSVGSALFNATSCN
jgi:hypothetical protein